MFVWQAGVQEAALRGCIKGVVGACTTTREWGQAEGLLKERKEAWEQGREGRPEEWGFPPLGGKRPLGIQEAGGVSAVRWGEARLGGLLTD